MEAAALMSSGAKACSGLSIIPCNKTRAASLLEELSTRLPLSMGAEAEDGITCQRSYKAYFLHSCNCVASEKPDWPQAGSFLFLDLLKVISVGLTSFLTRSGNAKRPFTLLLLAISRSINTHSATSLSTRCLTVFNLI